jgi:HD-like signal output (HDOD) protein
MYELEQEMLGYCHAEIGGRLLEFWKVPRSIWEPVVTHHDPGSGGEFLLAACAIHIADAWINTHHIGSSGAGFELNIAPEAMQTLGVDSEDVDQAGKLASEQTHAIVRQFMSH